MSLRAGGTACVRRWIPWFGSVGFVALSRSQHGRDGRAPFFSQSQVGNARPLAVPCLSRPPARSLRLGERSDPTLVNGCDTKDWFKIRLSEGSRHDRFSDKWFENGVVDEVGEKIRRGLVAAFFERDSDLIVIFFSQ